MLLSELATVHVGNTFREGVLPDPSGGVLAVQMKDVSDGTGIAAKGLVRIQFDDVRESHQLRQGDIVLRSRGSNVVCASVPELSMPAMLVAPLYRIRVAEPLVDPRYLAWFINEHGRKYLESRSEGSDLKMVSLQSVKDLEVAVPSLSRQTEIVELAALVREEARIMESILRKRSKLVSSCLARAIHGESK